MNDILIYKLSPNDDKQITLSVEYDKIIGEKVWTLLLCVVKNTQKLIGQRIR